MGQNRGHTGEDNDVPGGGEIVASYRALAAQQPGQYLPRLAQSLHDQSERLGQLGHREQALDAADEATRIFRRLNQDDRGAHLPELAAALGNLGVRLHDSGRHDEAAARTEQAVSLRRRLAADDPDTGLPDLATALGTLATHLSEAGRQDEATARAAEAAQVHRELAEDDPSLHRPALATALTDLGTRLWESGHRDEALATAEEMVGIRRALARHDPAVHRPNYAVSLVNTGAWLAELGHPARAMTVTEQGVDLYRQLSAELPSFYLPRLAMALHNLGVQQAAAGRADAAVESCAEAVRTRLRLTRENPAAHRSDLAVSLRSLQSRLTGAGRVAEYEPAWTSALAGQAAATRGWLWLRRAGQAAPDEPRVAEWLTTGLELAADSAEVLSWGRAVARARRERNQESFDRRWTGHTGQPLPAWLTLDPALLATVERWTSTPTFEQEHDYLLEHQELLAATADAAVAEILLRTEPKEAARLTRLRDSAREIGVREAYRPLLLRSLAHRFATAGPEQQRELIATRRDDLLDLRTREAIGQLPGSLRERAEQADAVLTIAAEGIEDAYAVFEALRPPDGQPG